METIASGTAFLVLSVHPSPFEKFEIRCHVHVGGVNQGLIKRLHTGGG